MERYFIPLTKFNGFTIVELLVTVLIVSVMASVAFPMVELTVQRNKERELRQNLQQIREALDAYKRAVEGGHIQRKVGDSGYPPSLNTLVEGVTDIRSPTGGKIFFLRRIPRDPFSVENDVVASRTWGLRSYASSADDPRPGSDVYDIFSLSPRIGLNGVPYRDW